jgi:hypothetical protein
MPKLFKGRFIILEQNDLLRSLAPHFTRAKEEKQQERFFEELFILWFARFPENDDDPDMLGWAIKCRKKVSSVFYHYARSLTHHHLSPANKGRHAMDQMDIERFCIEEEAPLVRGNEGNG